MEPVDFCMEPPDSTGSPLVCPYCGNRVIFPHIYACVDTIIQDGKWYWIEMVYTPDGEDKQIMRSVDAKDGSLYHFCYMDRGDLSINL